MDVQSDELRGKVYKYSQVLDGIGAVSNGVWAVQRIVKNSGCGGSKLAMEP